MRRWFQKKASRPFEFSPQIMLLYLPWVVHSLVFQHNLMYTQISPSGRNNCLNENRLDIYFKWQFFYDRVNPLDNIVSGFRQVFSIRKYGSSRGHLTWPTFMDAIWPTLGAGSLPTLIFEGVELSRHSFLQGWNFADKATFYAERFCYAYLKLNLCLKFS